MNERQIPRVVKAALALLILFGLGSLLYNSGYSSGMATGLLVSSSEGSAMSPYLLSQMGGMHGGFGFFGGLLRFGFFLVFLAVIAKFFGFARWKMRMQHNFASAGGEGGEAGNGPRSFHPMWEMHRKWHQAEQTAATAPEETPAPTAPPAPPVEEK